MNTAVDRSHEGPPAPSDPAPAPPADASPRRTGRGTSGTGRGTSRTGRGTSRTGRATAPRRICVVGCGPRGASVVERILANAPEVLAGARLDLHVVDPYPPGAGRTWHTDQPRLLWMNSAAAEVTMFPDASVTCAGPARPGPTTGEWLGGPFHDGAYAARADQGRYLRWFFDEVTGRLPYGVRLFVHRTRALDVVRTGGSGGAQRVVLEGAAPLEVDHVVIAPGHLGARPAPAPAGVTRIGPGPADPERLDAIPPGAAVVTRGLGLVFVDCAILLTQGRGGRFLREDGRLRYVPSGREPRLVAGSRRGVPLPPRPAPRAAADEPYEPPRIATLAACRERLARPGASFRADVWPLVVAELTWRWYRALWSRRPGRVTLRWEEFDERFRSLPPGDPRQTQLIRSAVPDPADRLDLARLEAPLAGRRWSGPDALQRDVLAHMRQALRRRTDPAGGAEAAVVSALAATGAVVEELWRSGEMAAPDVAEALERFSFGAFLSSGPPVLRAEQLLALAEAGVVTFTGPGTRVETVPGDDGRHVVRAHSPAVPVVHEAAVLLEARMEPGGAKDAGNPLIRALAGRGELTEDQEAGAGAGLLRLHGPALHPVGADGRVHRDRTVAGPAQFPRAGTDAAFFRQNDAVARCALGAL
ncbi:FAD/NAD(P)-binding protein [Streptomyces thermocoprophilus]|uniref:FAD/NAD(P)-binding protein n=1 Tax=Streptomyces thermocoprophilus TaxID=78356 RepID=A0ABV5VIE9_9ACTN